MRRHVRRAKLEIIVELWGGTFRFAGGNSGAGINLTDKFFAESWAQAKTQFQCDSEYRTGDGSVPRGCHYVYT